MSEELGDDFAQAMGGVKALKQDNRVLLNKGSYDAVNHSARRQAAENHPVQAISGLLPESEAPRIAPDAILDFRRPGVQHGVYKQLRMGRYSIDARLDLHGLTIQQSRQAVSFFVRDCMENDIRCALITHGKGKERKEPALLKSYVAYWLPQIDFVLAFHSAQPQHGGVGSCYILLKKSERKRLENQEQHQKRSS